MPGAPGNVAVAVRSNQCFGSADECCGPAGEGICP
jgi:hypothetical protein